MKTYLCDHLTEDGLECCVAFDADTWEEAQLIADKNGWMLLCECLDEPEVEMFAIQIENHTLQ